VCPKSGHGFTSDHPQPSMFDVKTMTLIKTIEVPTGFSADGIYCDQFNNRVYIGSHPTKSVLVVDAKDGTVLGNVDLGGRPSPMERHRLPDAPGTARQRREGRRQAGAAPTAFGRGGAGAIPGSFTIIMVGK
jgi:hypothetical protein